MKLFEKIKVLTAFEEVMKKRRENLEDLNEEIRDAGEDAKREICLATIKFYIQTLIEKGYQRKNMLIITSKKEYDNLTLLFALGRRYGCVSYIRDGILPRFNDDFTVKEIDGVRIKVDDTISNLYIKAKRGRY